ncbi:MAG: hypothetical protein IJL85_04320 [Erysipelotrichaceae bacterium]|nr:hypothetical protein [Erysipelotrichaceae bacterium]
MRNYDDIIDLPHFVSKNRHQMEINERAAQFAPFAGLVGFGESISEASRLTDCFIELSDEEKQELDQKFQILENHLKEQPEVKIEYFVKDEKKSGGAYMSTTAVIRRVDLVERRLIAMDKRSFSFDDIRDLESPLFQELYD